MPILARMYVDRVESWGYQGSEKNDVPPEKTQENVFLKAVYSDDPEDPNYSYSEATPSGSMELTITNKKAFGFFEPGASYNIEVRKYTPSKRS